MKILKKEKLVKSNVGGPFRFQPQSQEERQFQNKPYTRNPVNFMNPQQNHHNTPAGWGGNHGNQGPNMVKCYNCGRLGHYASNFNMREVTCYKCGKIGHVSKDYRLKKDEPIANNANRVGH